jgi:hypothetical protein
MLNNTGRQIVNTREIEIITGYEITGQDEQGNNYYDYSKPKYSKMKAGSFKVGGNSNGKYVIINNLYISISNGNWDAMDDQSGSQYDNTGENCAYWHEGAEITISKKGSTFDISITNGDLTVKNLTVTLYHKMNDSGGGGDGSDDEYKGPTIEGAYITDYKELGNNMYSYKIESGTFKGVSGDQVTQNSLGNFLFVPGSDFKEGSIIQPDGTRAKYDSRIKKDGSIDAYGAKWYEKLWDGIVGFFSILAFSLMIVFTLGAVVWAKDMKGMQWSKEWAAITYGYWNHVQANGSNEEAVERGMDLGTAGLMAVAILICTAITSIFTGGASVIGAIAMVAAMVGAVSSAVSVINLTYSAMQALKAGKIGQAALMLFLVFVTALVTCLGGIQMGSSIGSSLVSLGKQFFIKMAIGAGAEAQVASAAAKAVARDVAQQVAKGVSDEVATKVGQEVANDVSKEISKQVSKEVGKEVGQEIAENVAKEVSKEVGKNVVEDLATNVAKSVESQVVEALSGKVSEEVAEKIAKSVADKVAKSISRSISENLAKNVSVTVGQIAKEMILGGTSFKRQAGQTTLQFVGTFAKSGLTVVGRVGIQALNGYMTYMSAKSFVDSIESGDFMGAVKTMYTLISIDIIMPVMSAHSAIKEGGSLKVGEVGKEGSAELTSSAKEAEKVGSGGMRIQGMSVGWKVGSVAITTVVGAGVGIGIAAIIDVVSGKKIIAKDLIIGGAVGGAVGLGFGALATKADWTSLGNSVKTSIAKTLAPFGGKTAQLVRGADGGIVVKELSEFSGATMVRAWGGLVGGGALGVGAGVGIWAAKGRKKEEMARYLIIGGAAGGVLGAGFANAWSSGAYKGYKGVWQNFKADPGGVFRQVKEYVQESLVKTLMMVQEINIFNTYMAYGTGILNQIYNKITGGSLANTDIVKFINKVTGMSLFKTQADLEEEREYENRKKKAEEKGEEFKEEGVVYKARFGEAEAKAVIEQNWGSLTSPTMYVGNVVGGLLKPVLGAALQHSPILGSVMNVMESASSVSIMQKHKIVSMFYNMGVKIRVLNIITKEVFDDPNSEEDDQIAEVMGGFAFMQMFEAMPVQEQAEAMKFLESSKEISYKDKNGKPVKVEVGIELYKSATLLKNSSSKNFEANLKTVCSNLELSNEEVSEYVKSGMEFKQIVDSLVSEYVIKGLSLGGGLSRENLKEIIETSPIMKQGAGLPSFDIINSISSKLNYVDACAKILSLNIKEIPLESLAKGSLSKEQYTKILQAQDDKQIASGVGLLMNYLSGISSVSNLAINDLIGAVSEYKSSIYNDGLNKIYEFELRQAIKSNLESLNLLKLSEVQINRISENVLSKGALGADNKLTAEARQAIREALEKRGSNVVVNLIVRNIESNMRSLRAEAMGRVKNIDSLKAKLAEVQEPVNKAKGEVEQVLKAQKEILSLKGKIETLKSDIEKYKKEKESSKGNSQEAQKSFDDVNKKYSSMREEVKRLEVIGSDAQVESKQIDLNEAENKYKSIEGIEAIKGYVNAFENTYSADREITIGYMSAMLGTSGVAKYDPKTKELMRSLEKQSFIGRSYVAYASLRESAAIKEAVEIERLRNISESARSDEQKGQLALLEEKYLPLEIEFNSKINNMLKEVGIGKLSYEEFNLVIGASDILYSRVTSVGERVKLADYRREMTEAAVNMAKEVIETTKQLQKEGQISKEGAKEIIDSIRSRSKISANEVGNVKALVDSTYSARSMISSVRTSNILPVVTAKGTFLTYNTGAGKDVVEVKSVRNSEKGMKVNVRVNGKEIGEVVFRNNLEAITNNKVVAQAIVEKYPNMMAVEIAVNNVGKGVIESTLKSLKILNLSEDQINRIVEIVVKEGAFGIDNKVRVQSQKAIEEIVGSKVVANLVIRSIENTRLDLKEKLENVLSRREALVLQGGSFRTSSDGRSSDGKQIENKGYILSSSARSEISELLGVEEAKGVIESIEATLNTERMVNDVKMFRSDASQLIKMI